MNESVSTAAEYDTLTESAHVDLLVPRRQFIFGFAENALF